jgi:glycerol-3-phosphate dehydrogenase
LLEHFAEYFAPAPTRDDVLSVYAGLRPLVKPKHEAGATSKISREHRIVTSAGGLVSILGGKWTTFRKMAEDVTNAAEEVAELKHQLPSTRTLCLTDNGGSDAATPDLGPTPEQVAIAAESEFARTVEDVLARRYRSLLLDAKGSTKLAPEVAAVLAEKLGRPPEWIDEQICQYEELADQYSL